jgi:hypothetical protein
MTKIDDACTALAKAEEKITEAEKARDDARWALDNELASIGWHRASAIFSPDAVPRYENIAYTSSHLTVGEVQRLIEQQKAALAL